jgi:hypothetical protein
MTASPSPLPSHPASSRSFRARVCRGHPRRLHADVESVSLPLPYSKEQKAKEDAAQVQAQQQQEDKQQKEVQEASRQMDEVLAFLQEKLGALKEVRRSLPASRCFSQLCMACPPHRHPVMGAIPFPFPQRSYPQDPPPSVPSPTQGPLTQPC